MVKNQHLIMAREIIEDVTYRICSANNGREFEKMKNECEYIGNQRVYNALDEARFNLRMARIPGKAKNITVLRG